MRRFWILMLVAGCRFNFEERTPAGDATSDGAPVPTCTGHDEDGDGFPDACDVCPTVPDPLQLDRMEISAGNPADGVGDACDPRPALGGDYIQVFDAHTSSATTTYWKLNGQVSWPADALRLGAANALGQAEFILPALPTRLETRMHVLAASATAVQWFGFWYSSDGPGITKVIAEADDDPVDGLPVEINLNQDDNGVRTTSISLYGPAATIAAGDTYSMTVETSLATGGEDVMYVVEPDGQMRTTSLLLTIPRDVNGFLEANNVQIDYDYFIAYAIH